MKNGRSTTRRTGRTYCSGFASGCVGRRCRRDGTLPCTSPPSPPSESLTDATHSYAASQLCTKRAHVVFSSSYSSYSLSLSLTRTHPAHSLLTRCAVIIILLPCTEQPPPAASRPCIRRSEKKNNVLKKKIRVKYELAHAYRLWIILFWSA